MTARDPTVAIESNDPVIDLALGLYSVSRRINETLERLAPPVESVSPPADSAEPHILVLLGLVSTSQALVRALENACPPQPAVEIQVGVSRRESIWR